MGDPRVPTSLATCGSFLRAQHSGLVPQDSGLRMRRFFIPASLISQAHVTLSGMEFHHLRHVLRLRIGDTVTLKDDLGREHEGVISQLTSSEATITITSTTEALSSRFSLTLAQGLLKGQKMDVLIEKTTELGVQRLAPFTSTFTVAQLLNERQMERIARWTRIAQSAAKQSGSAAPHIEPPHSFANLLTTIPTGTTTLLFYEKEARLTLKEFAMEHKQLDTLCIIVGSEGGFSLEEIGAARAAGVQVVSLGSRILRAETAGIVATALSQFLWES
jgi:16S rRNA (uracil1498-N3)-methyltransferase